MSNIVYIATSLDGFIADRDGGIDWLSMVPNPDGGDLGFADFMARVDVVVMGRVTFDTVVGFGMGWPYPVPGIILSTTMTTVPDDFSGHVRVANGGPAEICQLAEGLGYKNLYIDGGKTIQGFLQADLIDEMIITEVPVLLGGGERLFGSLEENLAFEFIDHSVLIGQLAQKHYARKR